MTVRRPCSTCGGSGCLGIVSREMASDAGSPELEGQPIGCSTCGGDGYIVEEVEDESGGEHA